MSKVKGMLVCWDKKLTGKHLLTTNYSIVGIPPYQSLIRLHLLFTTRSSCCRIFLVAPRSNFDLVVVEFFWWHQDLILCLHVKKDSKS